MLRLHYWDIYICCNGKDLHVVRATAYGHLMGDVVPRHLTLATTNGEGINQIAVPESIKNSAPS